MKEKIFLQPGRNGLRHTISKKFVGKCRQERLAYYSSPGTFQNSSNAEF